ncbi:MAG: metallophosphoesterase [Dehalococcoidaceae bacterium]|nr:metallophosphoesterase [Dehalococcoidaceae bacterium]
MKNLKKRLPSVMSLAGGLLVALFLWWALIQHGTIGLLRINLLARWGFILLGLLGMALLALAALMLWLKDGVKKWIQIIALAVSTGTIIIMLAGFAITGGIFAGGTGNSPPQLFMTGHTGVYGITDMAVVFNTEKSCVNTLYWGAGEELLEIEETAPGRQHVFILEDLQPGGAYRYRINDGPVYTFTAPAVDGTVHFAVAGDAHFGAPASRGDYTAQMLDYISRPENGFDMFLFAGDLVEYGFATGQWREAFEAFSAVSSNIPTAMAAGNHDTLFSGLGNYLELCRPEGMVNGDSFRLWYRLDVGRVHFLVLDVEWSAESFSREQEQWLRAQLESIPEDEWKIVINHGYYYASGLRIHGWGWYDNPETIERIVPLFEEYGVDMVFSGHNHRLELLENNGIVYAVGAPFGGSTDAPVVYTSPSNLWDGTGERGFIDVVIEDDECTLIFRNHEAEVLKEYAFSRK